MKSVNLLSFLYCFLVLHTPLNAQNKPWTLKACIDTALQRNITLKQQQSGNDISKINLQQSKDNLYPNLFITDAPSLNFGKSVNSTGQYVSQNTADNSFAVTSSITLFDGFQYQNTIKENKYLYDAGVKGIEKTRNDISLNILAGYLQVLVSYEAVNISESQLEASNSLLGQTKKYVDAGKIPESNLLQIQSQLAEDKLAKVNAENQLRLAKVGLMQLMNLPIVNDFDIERPSSDDTTITPSPLSSDDIYKTGEFFLPEIQSAQLNSSATEMEFKVAKGLYTPKLTMGGSIRTSGSSLAYQTLYQPGTIGYLQPDPSNIVIGYVPETSTSNNFTNLWNQMGDNFNEVIGLNLSIPIFNNFQARNTVAIAKINITNSKLTEESVKIELRQTIEQAYTQMLASASQYIAAREALRAEQQTYINLEKKFKIGLSSATEYLIEKANYTKAEQAVIQAKYTFLFKTKLIDFYSGKPITM